MTAQIEADHVDAAIKLLLDASQNITRHDGLKTREKHQIAEAFQLLDAQPKGEISKRARRESSYQSFLQKVQQATSHSMVALCAIGLGKSRVASMRDGVRLSLPLRIKARSEALDSPVLQTISHEIRSEAARNGAPSSHAEASIERAWSDVDAEAGTIVVNTGSLSGRVYHLTPRDARALVMSTNVLGGIWLTDPYDVNCPPFVTIQISKELSTQYATQRPQSM